VQATGQYQPTDTAIGRSLCDLVGTHHVGREQPFPGGGGIRNRGQVNHRVGTGEEAMASVRVGHVQCGDVFARFQVSAQYVPISWQQRNDRLSNLAASPSQHYASPRLHHDLDATYAYALVICEIKSALGRQSSLSCVSTTTGTPRGWVTFHPSAKSNNSRPTTNAPRPAVQAGQYSAPCGVRVKESSPTAVGTLMSPLSYQSNRLPSVLSGLAMKPSNDIDADETTLPIKRSHLDESAYEIWPRPLMTAHRPDTRKFGTIDSLTVTSARLMHANILAGGRREVAAKASDKNDPDRTPDRLAAGFAFAFIVLLLATELVLTLPDEADSPSFVAKFYAERRAFIIALQILGVVDALLLGAYAWRLYSVDRFVGWAGLLMAFCALAPTMITLVLAIVADPAHTETAAGWNMLEPRGDDILFAGIVVFASAVAVRLGRNKPALGVLALVVAVACLLRLLLEAAGKSRGALEAVGPLLFVVLIATMAVLSFRGVLRAGPRRLRRSAAPAR